MSKKNYKNQPTVLETVVVGIFKGIWWLIKLPFGGLKKKSGISKEEQNAIRSKAREIEKLASSDNIIELKHAVMEADKLVDKVLRLKGYGEGTFADRLKKAEQYTDRKVYQDLWDGHKVRNRLAHDESHISENELKGAVNKLIRYVRNI